MARPAALRPAIAAAQHIPRVGGVRQRREMRPESALTGALVDSLLKRSLAATFCAISRSTALLSPHRSAAGTSCRQAHVRCFHATAVSASGVSYRKKTIPALPPARDEFGKMKRVAADDVFFHDTGNAYTREVFGKASKETKAVDPCFLWLHTGGLRFYDILEKPRNFLMGDCPYPMNPWYKAMPPICNETRNTVFLLHHEDPKKWTPYRLAEEFGLSVSRVEAIIKSKTVEVQMYRNGEVVENTFAAAMDKILGSKYIRRRAAQALELPFHLKEPKTMSPTPRIVAVPEECNFDPETAATRLYVEPIAEAHKELREKAEARAPNFTNLAEAISGKVCVLTHDELAKAAPIIEPPNSRLANPRHCFRITDLSNKFGGGEYGRRTLVRDRDGSLREATPIERKAALERRAKSPDSSIGKWGKRYYKGRKLLIDRVNGVHYKISPYRWF